MGAPLVDGHVTRRHGVLGHRSAGSGAGFGQRPVGVLDDELLAENVDILPCAPCETNAVGIRRGELHAVADLVAPQPVVGGDEHGIAPSRHHALQRHDVVAVAELEIGAVVEHQQHVVAPGIVGQGEKALRSVVGLHVTHVGRRDQRLERPAVGSELHAAVGEKRQVGPHLQEVALTRIFEHAPHQGEVPRRDPGEGGDMLARTLAGDGLGLAVEVGDDGRAAPGSPHPPAHQSRFADQ